MIGERVKQKRLELGITQLELAKRLGYNCRSTIGHIEDNTNDVPLHKVEKLAKALGTTPAYLMGWEQDERLLSYYERLTDMFKKLDDVDRARIEERMTMMLEQEKYR